MAEEPNDLTIRILREIQATLFNHDLRFEQIDKRFEQIDRRLESMEKRTEDQFRSTQTQIDRRFDIVDERMAEVLDTAVTALGSAGHANLRHDKVRHQIEEFELELRKVQSRLQHLEEKV